jgi:hypothetical protein
VPGSEAAAKITAELKEVEDTLRRLRGEEPSVSPDPGDHSDDAADLTNYEEEQALIENLESRRQRLADELRQLDSSTGP